MRPVRALIVDDERLARRGVRRHLEAREGVEIVGECGSGEAAVEAIEELAPDLVFLDIQMPGLDGFDVVRRIGVDAMPPVIFVTAYDEHALRAFEVHAVDYLLKPIDPERFDQAYRRAVRRLEREDLAALGERLRAVLKDAAPELGVRPAPSETLRRLVVRKAGRIVFVDIDTIDWIGSAGNYVELHSGDESYLTRRTMKEMERRLDRRRFVRVHRSTIVNVDRIDHLEPHAKGTYRIVLKDGTELFSSRGYRENIEELLDRGV